MPIWVHIILTYVSLYGGFAIIAFSVWGYWGAILNAVPESWGGARSIIGFSIAVGVLWLGNMPAYLFATRIPVRCAKAGCAGRAYGAFAPTITYTCALCKQVQRTSFGIGKR